MSDWKDYFTFDKRQRNGIIILLLLIFFSVLTRILLPYIYPLQDYVEVNLDEEIISFENSIIENSNPVKEKNNIRLFKFNPNHLSKEKWRLLGLSDRQIDIIYNYESKGGQFRTKEDVKKIYGINEQLYNKWELYIEIPKKNKNDEFKQTDNISLFHFNPNKLPQVKWKMLGLKDWQIKIIYNYESKGGQFRTKEDLSKIYGIDKELFKKWEPYIVIPGNETIVKVQLTTSSKLKELSPSNFNGLENVSYYKEHGYYKYTLGEVHTQKEAKNLLKKVKESGFDSAFLVAFKNGKKIPINTAFNTTKNKVSNSNLKQKIELNSADSIQLISVRGIGPIYAQRIIKYRKRLGGFIELNQLKEVFGITEDNYENIAAQLELDTVKRSKININDCNWGRLVSHPYIDKNVANLLINYRKSHGHFATVKDITKSDLVNEDLYLKIAPYLKTD